jgi:hypothetical protein
MSFHWLELLSKVALESAKYSMAQRDQHEADSDCNPESEHEVVGVIGDSLAAHPKRPLKAENGKGYWVISVNIE